MVVAMIAPDAYCDFCDLPLAQCVHGQPPPPPAPKPVTAAPAKPRARATRRARPSASSVSSVSSVSAAPPASPAAPGKPVNRRWTSPEAFKPLILAVLEEAGGELDADELFLELEIAAEDRLLPGDSETTPGGELRWQYAARRARMALIDEGLMTKGRPGVWLLAGSAPR